MGSDWFLVALNAGILALRYSRFSLQIHNENLAENFQFQCKTRPQNRPFFLLFFRSKITFFVFFFSFFVFTNSATLNHVQLSVFRYFAWKKWFFDFFSDIFLSWPNKSRVSVGSSRRRSGRRIRGVDATRTAASLSLWLVDYFHSSTDHRKKSTRNWNSPKF